MSETKTRVRLGGLWKHTTRKGETVLSGSFGQGQIVIFTNSYKQSETDPDFVMYVEPKPERQAGSGGSPR